MAERTTTSRAAKLRFAAALLKTSFRAAAALRGAFAMQVAFMALNNWVFFTFWWLLLRRVPSIRGFLLHDIAALYGVVAAGYGLAVVLAGGVIRLARMIDEGELDTLLTQPQPKLLYALGSHSRASGAGDVFSGLVLLAVYGELPLARVPLALLAVALSAITFVAFGVLSFSAAFWLGRSESAAIKLWELLLTFSLYPEPLFGGGLRVVLFTLLPAAFASFLPTRLLRAPSATDLAFAVTGALAHALLASWVFRRGLRRYASGSRFGVWG